MKVLLINGSSNVKGSTFAALDILSNKLKEKGVDSKILHIGVKNNSCTNCNKCKETGVCIFNDEVNEALKSLDDYKGIVIGTPVYYSAPTGGIISFLNRLFKIGSKKLEYKVASSIAVARRAGTTSTIDVINKYFLYNNMPIVPSNYWNGSFGMNGEEINEDVEGIEILTNLAENMTWLLKSISLAKKGGVNHPAYKERYYERKR